MNQPGNIRASLIQSLRAAGKGMVADKKKDRKSNNIPQLLVWFEILCAWIILPYWYYGKKNGPR